MDLALYDPEDGYYLQDSSQVGTSGDFFTSVSAGPFFGELVAEFLAPLLRLLPPEDRTIWECGAHDGQWALDLLQAFKQSHAELFSSIRYCILEPNATRRRWQEKTLAGWSNLHWFDSATLPSDWSGFCLSNELLDAFPVHRLFWNKSASRWDEWGVGAEQDKFSWVPMPVSRPGLEPNFPASLLDVLPDGFIYEVSPGAEDWWQSACTRLRTGGIVAFDYGFSAEEVISPSRLQGTLRAYRNHRLVEDLLADPGEQDLTAHVRFDRMLEIGEAAGLATRLFETQERFLGKVAARLPQERWTPDRVRQYQTLARPEMLGRSFKVLFQSR